MKSASKMDIDLLRELQALRDENAKIRKENNEMPKQIQELLNKIEEQTIAIKVRNTIRKDDYSSDDSTASSVSKRKRKIRTPNKSPQTSKSLEIPVQNRFEVLSNDQEMDDSDNGTVVSENSKQKKTQQKTHQKTIPTVRKKKKSPSSY